MLYFQGDQEIPADCVLIASNDAESGSAYVETSQLDGESNLKLKDALGDTKQAKRIEDIVKLEGLQLNCEAPNANLDRFYGTCRLQGDVRSAF